MSASQPTSAAIASAAHQRAHAAAQAAAGYVPSQQNQAQNSRSSSSPASGPGNVSNKNGVTKSSSSASGVGSASAKAKASSVSASALASATPNMTSSSAHQGAATSVQKSSSATSTIAVATAVSLSNSKPKEYLWQLDSNRVRQWMESTHVLIPKMPPLRIDPNTQLPSVPGTIRGNAKAYELQQRHLQEKEQKEYGEQMAIGQILLSNLVNALDSASRPSLSSSTDTNQGNKRIKTNSGASIDSSSTSTTPNSRDMFNILDSSFAEGEHIIHKPGAILSRITSGGLLNALAGHIGGVVDVLTSQPITPPTTDSNPDTVPPAAMTETTPIRTASNLTLETLRMDHATRLHKSIIARLEMDKLNSTPERIVEMLCPELTMTDVISIRKRIVETVILGKGTGSSAALAERLDGGSDDPVLAKVGDAKREFKKCGGCGNNDQNQFVMDQKNGDLICKLCGTIVEESLMHEGSQFRKFEGEVDRNHHGDAPNPMFSNGYNMGTSLGGMTFQSGAGMGGYGSQGSRGMENVLRNAHAYIEMNMSQFGKEERRTRIGYKDKQKRSAIVEMKHVGDALSLHQAVLERAKELFAGFRDDRELVQQLQGVLAACLCEAFDQLSNDGRQILKLKTGEDSDEDQEDLSKKGGGESKRKKSSAPMKLTGLHKTTLVKKKVNAANGDSNGSVISEKEKKPLSQWNLDDTRSWLLEASQNIAKQWEHENNELQNSNKLESSIPQGSREELEGTLVQHTLKICNIMEEDLNNSMNENSRQPGKQRVKTPRVTNGMGSLGIKWQHKHERGSGGAGGVGNSGHGKLGGRPSKTAGQMLILKSAKKRLGVEINDQVAGDAFQREIQALLKRQQILADKQRSEQATTRRMNMHRRRKRTN